MILGTEQLYQFVHFMDPHLALCLILFCRQNGPNHLNISTGLYPTKGDKSLIKLCLSPYVEDQEYVFKQILSQMFCLLRQESIYGREGTGEMGQPCSEPTSFSSFY